MRKPKKYDDFDAKESPRDRVASTEQSVSERGQTPVVAQNVKADTEREHQVQSSSADDSHPVNE
jgi:serine/threonine-protein kinase PRP4